MAPPGTYAYVNPVVAVTLVSALLGEPISASLLVGGALILAAVLLSTTGRSSAPAPRGAPEPVAEGEATPSAAR